MVNNRLDSPEVAADMHTPEQNESGNFADGREVRTPDDAVTLSLPIVQPDVVVPVIELFLK